MGSPTVYIRAIVPPDEAHKHHIAIYEACKALGIDPPMETEEHLCSVPPDPQRRPIDLGNLDHGGFTGPTGTEGEGVGWAFSRSGDHGPGVDIDLSALPEGTTHLQVSW